jgi:hypothetical protein
VAGATLADLTSLYGNLLGRAPDQSGIGTYTGMDVNKVRSSILGSSEYQGRVQSQNNSLVDYAKDSSNQLTNLLNSQKAEQQGLFDQYTSAVNGQEKLPDLYTRLNTQLGIPDISNQLQTYKDQIYRVKGLLDSLDDNVTSRTQGTLTTEAQRNRIIASEADPLNNELGRLGTGAQPFADMLTSAQGQLSALLPLYVQQQEKELSPLELQINSLGDRYAREISGFTANREETFNALADKLDRDRTLQDNEWQVMQQIATEEREYARQKATAAASAKSYLAATIPASQGATNTQTSTTTRQLPSVSTASSPLFGAGNWTPYVQGGLGAATNMGNNLLSLLGAK